MPNIKTITTITADADGYPKALINKTPDSRPPFYYVGDLSLLDRKLLAVAGSRNIDAKGRDFTEKVAGNAVSDGYGIVSGGAVGVDYFARRAAISRGGVLVEFVPDTLRARAKNAENAKLIEAGRLLLLSDTDPNAAFTGKAALRRNRYIYTCAVAGLVVRCDYEKGGSWSGGLWAHRRKICPVYTWRNPEYEGNQGLIKLGVIGVDDDFRLGKA
jgi:predicted Rossmann fold nucleotide-binding protein DprA/Smf involved in DNA uptake